MVRDSRSDNPFRIGYIAAPQLLAIGPFPCLCPIFHCLCGRFVRLTVASLFELARESDVAISSKITTTTTTTTTKTDDDNNNSRFQYYRPSLPLIALLGIR